MKKYALAAAAALALGGSAVRADFQYNLIYNPGYPSSGVFPGGDQWTLQVKNDGANGSGSNLSINGVTMLSLNTNGTVNKNGVFYIRTWNGNQADFMNQGGETPTMSYVNLGSTGVGISTPDENSQAYTDFQTVPWSSSVPNFATGTQGFGGNIDVAQSPGGSGGGSIPDSTFQTLAVAVVPHGQNVTFDMLLSSETNYGLTKVISALPGDANFDGHVSGADLTIVLGKYGTHGNTWASGDFNGDGIVSGADLTVLLGSYGKGLTLPPSLAPASANLAAVAVPEPAAAVTVVLGLAGFALRRRRQA